MSGPRLSVRETFGLSPLTVRAREAWMAVRGDERVPGTRFDLSSLGILHPALSVRTWLGRRRADRRVPISNLVNRTPPPVADGWSLRRTQVRDWRGGALSYDSHNGTDFAVPLGTVVVAAAPGVVQRISSEFDRGGLKVFLDHGDGLATTYNHLGRPLVRVGQVVERGEPIALSGYSGIDAVVVFPWSVPHVHFNVWLDGEYVDPFGAGDEPPMWMHGNDPRPAPPGLHDPAPVPDLDPAAMDALFLHNYYPTRFDERPAFYATTHPREPRLTLPFRGDDFIGVAYADQSVPPSTSTATSP
ncbi:MAG TPA: M23 family metallopeptidase [Kofleriaceae bacterium]|nr:M23 family metallopeptidase [Kofleriaceae bacterium]